MSHDSDPLSPFPKTLLLHLLPSALSSSETYKSAALVTSLGHSCGVWPEVLSLDMCQSKHLQSAAGGAGKGRVGPFSRTVLTCTRVDKGLARVTLALLPVPLKAVPLRGRLLLSHGDCGAVALLQTERMPLGCPTVSAGGESIPEHLTDGEGREGSTQTPCSALQHRWAKQDLGHLPRERCALC